MNGEALSSASPVVDSFIEGDLVFRDLDPTADHEEEASSGISTIEAAWGFSCLEDPSDTYSVDWDSVGRASQLLMFNIRSVDGRTLGDDDASDVTIVVQFTQTEPEILSIAGPVTVVAEGDFSPLSAAAETALLADLVELEELHRQLADLKATVARKEEYMASVYGLGASATDGQGECVLGRLRCAVQGIAARLKKLVIQVFGEEAARNCGLFSWGESDGNQTESSRTSIDTILKPKPTHEHPLVGDSGSSSSGTSLSSYDGEAKTFSFSDVSCPVFYVRFCHGSNITTD